MRLRGLRLEIILTAQPLGKHRADAQVSGGEEPLAPARRRQTAEEGAEPARPPRETRRGEGHTRSAGRRGRAGWGGRGAQMEIARGARPSSPMTRPPCLKSDPPFRCC